MSLYWLRILQTPLHIYFETGQQKNPMGGFEEVGIAQDYYNENTRYPPFAAADHNKPLAIRKRCQQ